MPILRPLLISPYKAEEPLENLLRQSVDPPRVGQPKSTHESLRQLEFPIFPQSEFLNDLLIVYQDAHLSQDVRHLIQRLMRSLLLPQDVVVDRLEDS